MKTGINVPIPRERSQYPSLFSTWVLQLHPGTQTMSSSQQFSSWGQPRLAKAKCMLLTLSLTESLTSNFFMFSFLFQRHSAISWIWDLPSSYKAELLYVTSCAISIWSHCPRTIFLVWLLLWHLFDGILLWHLLLCHTENEPLVFEGFDYLSHLSLKALLSLLASPHCQQLPPTMMLDVQTSCSAPPPHQLLGTVINSHIMTDFFSHLPS